MRLKECREQRGLTLKVLAEKAKVHWVSLANIEAGRKDPRLSTLLKVCKALNVTIAELVGTGEPLKKGGK